MMPGYDMSNPADVAAFIQEQDHRVTVEEKDKGIPSRRKWWYDYFKADKDREFMLMVDEKIKELRNGKK